MNEKRVRGGRFSVLLLTHFTVLVALVSVPRRPRIEYAGAAYQVMNRGDYRADLFSPETTGASFEEAHIGVLFTG